MISFAIVIPNFNQSHFLPFALESLRHQSAPFNLAVMDGGSTDGFKDVIQQYSGIINYLRSAPDEGQAAAIKEGLNIISGDIITWLNADDYYFPGALEKVADYFVKHPEVDVVYGDAIHINRDGFFLSYFPPIQEFNASDLTRTCFICQPACFVRRCAYEKVGGIDSSLHFTMDWDLWCRLASFSAKFHYLHYVLAAVRYYPGTKTLSGNKQRYLEIWHIEKKYGKRLLPMSWPGFYLFDLMFKAKRTILENIAFSILRLLRRMKKSFIQIRKSHVESDLVNYGFHRWKSEVAGRGIIYMPWYDKRHLAKINLRVIPDNCSYHIIVNDVDSNILIAEHGNISIVPPYFARPKIKISIECLDQHCWSLLDFSCELTS